MTSETTPSASRGRTPASVYKVVAVFASPGVDEGLDPLDVGREQSIIEDSLRFAKVRKFEFEPRQAATVADVRRKLFEERPAVLHFSGHATDSAVMLEEEDGGADLVPANTFADEVTAQSTVKLVVLNGCRTGAHAPFFQRQNSKVAHVIAMAKEIGDKTALEFTRGFYVVLASGAGVQAAYGAGIRSIARKEAEEACIPLLFRRGTLIRPSDPIVSDPDDLSFETEVPSPEPPPEPDPGPKPRPTWPWIVAAASVVLAVALFLLLRKAPLTLLYAPTQTGTLRFSVTNRTGEEIAIESVCIRADPTVREHLRFGGCGASPSSVPTGGGAFDMTFDKIVWAPEGLYAQRDAFFERIKNQKLTFEVRAKPAAVGESMFVSESVALSNAHLRAFLKREGSDVGVFEDPQKAFNTDLCHCPDGDASPR
jgi:hypothetical protein